MANLKNKIIEYLGRDFSFEEVALQNDGDGDYIKSWNVAEAQPTNEQLNALESQANISEANNQVIETRRNLYGSTAEQLEYIVENGVSAFIEKQNQIKLDNPKE